MITAPVCPSGASSAMYESYLKRYDLYFATVKALSWASLKARAVPSPDSPTAPVFSAARVDATHESDANPPPPAQKPESSVRKVEAAVESVSPPHHLLSRSKLRRLRRKNAFSKLKESLSDDAVQRKRAAVELKTTYAEIARSKLLLEQQRVQLQAKRFDVAFEKVPLVNTVRKEWTEGEVKVSTVERLPHAPAIVSRPVSSSPSKGPGVRSAPRPQQPATSRPSLPTPKPKAPVPTLPADLRPWPRT